MNKAFVVKRSGGEYSTVMLPDGVVETMWFGDDGSQVVVGRTYQSLAAVSEAHISAFEAEQEVSK